MASPNLDLVKVKVQKKEKNYGVFVIEPLAPGFGITIANSLRRAILSSIEGAAITSVKINNNTHEFSTIKGVKEDLVEIILNLKSLRLKKLSADKEQAVLKLRATGPKVVLAKHFAKNPEIEILEKDHPIAILDKGAKLSIDAIVGSGKGYLPTENRQDEKLPLGHIAIDAIFTPIKKVNYTVENTRVGQITNYDKITFEITTDSSLDPEEALSKGAQILENHFAVIGQGYLKEKPAAKKPKK